MFVLVTESLLECLDHVMTRFDGILALFVELFQFRLVFLVEISLFLLGESMYICFNLEAVEWVLNVFTCGSLFLGFDSGGINSLSFCFLRLLFALVIMMVLLLLDERSGLLLILFRLFGSGDFSFFDSFLKFGQGVNEIVGILDSVRSLGEIQSAFHIFNSGLNFHD